jgi:hypothetical protein
MQTDYSYFIRQTGIALPLVGFYDAPEIRPFEPLVEPPATGRACIFAFYKKWLDGKTLMLTSENYGCGGAGSWLFDKQTRTRQQYIEFLVDEEGLKHNYHIMNQWLDSLKPYRPQNKYIMIGPLKPEMYQYLKSVSFFVNPDQLSMLAIAAQYHSSPVDEPPVISPFGSGCMQMVTVFKDTEIAQAAIGGTDMAMRQYLPPDMLVFTVTKSMFERICSIDKNSFLEKSFLNRLKKTRLKTKE